MLNIVTILLIILAYHCAALAGLLAWRKTLRALPLFLTVAAVHMTLNLIERSGSEVVRYTSAIGLLYGPLFYLFAREAAFADRRLEWRDGWLAVPFAAALLIPMPAELHRALALATTLIGVAAAMRATFAFRAQALLSRSSPQLARMDWLTWGTLGAVALAAFDVGRSLLVSENILIGSDDAAFAVTLAGLLALTSWLAFGAVEHAARGGPLLAVEQSLASSSEPSSAEAAANFQRTVRVLDDEKLFLEPGLRLADLAAAAALTPREASQAINACHGDNFSSYINGCRARHARALIELRQDDRPTFLQIALESGFSSKTTFNEAFKRETGLTPSAYAARLRSET